MFVIPAAAMMWSCKESGEITVVILYLLLLWFCYVCVSIYVCLSSASSSILGCYCSLVLSPHAKYVGVWVSEEFYRIHDGFVNSYTYSM